MSTTAGNPEKCPEYVSPDLPSRCTWSPKKDDTKKDPHRHAKPQPYGPRILNSILEQIGNTPLVRLNNIEKQYGLECELLAKCEYFNAGGSVKDRIGLRMIEDAEKDGRIEPGWTLIEPTSGNTGIGLALAAAVKGYKCIIVMPEKMSNEKVNVLHALGAEIIRTPNNARFDAPNSHISVAWKLQSQIKNSIILDQYRNPGNPLAHYDTTGLEILEQTANRVDMVVLGAGTGGTVTGIGRRIKESLPKCQVVGVDPLGSILAVPEELNKTDVAFYEVEGIGYDFVPTVLDRSVVDQWIKMGDKEGLEMARVLIRKEGLLCGGSSGTAVAAAVQVAKTLTKGQRCVVLLPDGVRNYMTKFLDDNWMDHRNFGIPSRKNSITPPWYYRQPIKDILKGVSLISISDTEKCVDAIRRMKVNGFDQLPVVVSGNNQSPNNSPPPQDSENKSNQILLGMVTVGEIMAKISAGAVTLDSPVEQVLVTKYPFVLIDDSLAILIKTLRSNPYVVIVDRKPDLALPNIYGIVTHIDILEYLEKLDENQQKNIDTIDNNDNKN